MSEITITVTKGDTLWDLARTHLGDPLRWPELYQGNRTTIGTNPDLIHPGQRLTIPGDRRAG